MKLNILSDLHLSQGELPLPENDADLVILAGDLGRPARAMAWASRIPKPVLYVAGNHEFYGGSIEGGVAELKQLCAGTRIRVLDCEAVVIGGVRFLGATLWTDFRLEGAGAAREAAMSEATRFMRDFSVVRIDGVPFTPQASAGLFDAQAAWLEARLAEPHAGPTVVVTHHAPSPRSIHPRFAGSPLNACFVSDAERLIDERRVQLWIHGHTHDSFDYRVAGTRVLCNARGYAKDGVNENPAFDANLLVEIDSNV
ncbi:MAG TPA: metallophosphoesterase [Burkholderiales bacterium]